MHEKPGDLQHALSDDQGRSRRLKAARRTRTCRRVGLCRSTVNQPDKGGQLSAEAGEEGHRRGEHRSIAHAPTQNGKRMSQGWTVCGRSKGKKQERFTALLHHLNRLTYSRQLLRALQRKASPGVDGVTWQEYGNRA